MLSATQATQICQECTQAFFSLDTLVYHASQSPQAFLSHLHFFLLQLCCHFVCIAAEVCRLVSIFSVAPSCMLRRLVVATNGRVNICIYVIKFQKIYFFSPEPENKMQSR